MERVPLLLDPAEYTALAQMAQRDLRPLPHEARHLVRAALREAGLLADADHEMADRLALEAPR